MKYLTGFLSFLTALVLLTVIPANAQIGQGDLTGVARGSVLPSVETISGELLRIETGPCESTTGHAYVGTHIFLATDESEEPLNIHLGASYAVTSHVNALEAGQILKLEVFRTEQMEANHFIAKSLTANDHKIAFRDDNLRPFWAGGRGASQWDERRVQLDDRRMQWDDRRVSRGSQRGRCCRAHVPRRGRW